MSNAFSHVIRPKLNRRKFIKGSAAAAALGVTASIASSHPKRAELRTRLNASKLPADHKVFEQYAEAVRKMHELPISDRRNWRRQAIIHADHCAHDRRFFFPWHRHYIHQFELICAELVGDPSFALPYWDWTVNRGSIPDAFYQLKPLNVEHWKDDGKHQASAWGQINTSGIRLLKKGVGLQDDARRGGEFTNASIERKLSNRSFSTLTAEIDRPHGIAHVVIGGHMADGLSPLDPIFWLHHSNVDRLWHQWQLAGNQSPNFTREWDHFSGPDGTAINAPMMACVETS